MKIFTKAVILLLLQFSILQAQSIEEWVSRYDGNGADKSYSITTDRSGFIYVTGSTSNGQNTDYITIKYNSEGKIQWSSVFNGPDNGEDCAHSIAADNEGNVYVTGYSTGNNSSMDFATIKYNSNGLVQWIKRYNGTANSADAAFMIKTDEYGNVYAAGQSIGTGTNFDCVLIKYNSSGDELWIKRYNGTGNASDVINDLAVDNSGNVYLTGSATNAENNFDFLTMKINQLGVTQWTVLYNDSANCADVSNSIALDNLGNVYVTGSATNTTNNTDYLTIKYDQSGNIIWQRRFDGTANGNDIAYSIAVNRYGDAYITGTGCNLISGFDYTTIKYKSDGSQQWIKTYNGNSNAYDEANHIILDEAGSIYVTGQSTGISTNSDYTTIKYNANGFEEWIKIYDGTGSNVDQVSLLAADKSGNIYVTGSSTGIITGLDFATIKYSQVMVGSGNNQNTAPDNFSLKQNYPNPFNPSTIIKFTVPRNEHYTNSNMNAELAVYDILGNLVQKLLKKDVTAGNYEIQWNAYGYSSGIYFYQIIISGSSSKIIFKDTKKMILSK